MDLNQITFTMATTTPITHVKDRIVEVPGLLTPKECSRLIAECEVKGFKPSPPSGGGHGRTGREGARTSQFLVRCYRIQPFTRSMTWSDAIASNHSREA